jgi:hypothetical protein
LLPAALLVAVLAFLLAHRSDDAALSVYPFLSDWIGASRLPDSPEVRFLVQAALLFLAPYLLWLLLVLLVTVAERGIWGSRKQRTGVFRRVFLAFYSFLLLVLSGALGAGVDAVKRRLAAELQIAPAAVAAAPFLAAAAAFLPALLLALPAAGFLKMRE